MADQDDDELVAAAEAAIDDVFDDTSVPMEATLARMQTLLSAVETKIESLKGDIKKQKQYDSQKRPD
jgi:hypothetical protein